MTDPRRTAPVDRRIQEQLEILAGVRGRAEDRALRVGDLLSTASPVMAPFMRIITAQIGSTLEASIKAPNSAIGRQIKAGQQAAEAAAQRAANAETKITEINLRVDGVVSGMETDLAAINGQIAALGEQADQISADIAADLASMQGEIDADIATLESTVTTGLAGVNTALTDLETAVGNDIATLQGNFTAFQSSVSTDLVTIQDLIDNLGGEISGDVAAYLSENYYSKTATDGQISAAIAASETTLGASIDGITATLASAYYTALQTDGAISTAISALETTLSSEIEDLGADITSTLSVSYFTKAQTMAEMVWAIEGAWQDEIPTAGYSTYAGISFGLTSRVDGIEADLSQNYLTSAETNGAISTAVAALQTSLGAQIDGLSATLGTTYYTKVETDGEIAEAVTAASVALTAEIGAVASNLATNYYTKAESDGEIASAVTALETSLEAQIDGVTSALATDYYTAAQTDSALAAVETALSSEIGGIAADLDANYYTTAQTDGAINTAISAVQTTLSAEIDGLTGTLATAYYTSVQTDGAISTAVSAVQTTLGAQIDGLSATLGATYYTKVETDGEIETAVSAVSLALSSEIGAVASDLATNHYTRTEADGEIEAAVSALETSLSSTIGALASTLETTYYTRTATDGAISTAVAALETSLEAQIDGVISALTTDYYTAAQTDSAIAALETTLAASIGGVAGDLASFSAMVGSTYATTVNLDEAIGTLNTQIRSELNRSTPPTGFTAGAAAWTSTASGSPEAVAAPHASWTFSAAVASQNAPSSTTGTMLVTRGAVPLAGSDTIRITASVKVTGSGPGLGGLVFFFNWLDAEFDTATIPVGIEDATVAPGEWMTVSASLIAPADAFWVRGGIALDGTAYGPDAQIDVRSIKVENLASIAEIQASIANDFYTKAQTDSAVAAGIASYDASIEGGIAANITQQAVALAGLNGAVATYSVLASADGGFNVAGMEVLAWDEEGASGTAVRLLGDEVMVPGSLTAGSLTVTDGSGELLPNWNFGFGDLRGWTQTSGSTAEVVAKTAGVDGLSTANARYTLRLPAGDGFREIIHDALIPCEAGRSFAVSFEAACGGDSTGASAVLRLRFYGADDALLQTSDITEALSGSTWVSGSGARVAPEGAVYFTAALRLTPPASAPIYVANVSVIRRRSGATLITPNSITTDELNVSELSAITANIGLLRSAETGERVEIADDTIKVFNAANIAIVKIGRLT